MVEVNNKVSKFLPNHLRIERANRLFEYKHMTMTVKAVDACGQTVRSI